MNKVVANHPGPNPVVLDNLSIHKPKLDMCRSVTRTCFSTSRRRSPPELSTLGALLSTGLSSYTQPTICVCRV
jgi:hypothetical protein